MLLKCYHHLHPMIEIIGCVDQIEDEDFCLDIFQQITSTSEPSKELVTRVLLIFKCCQVDPKDINCFFQWWGKHEAMLPIVGFLACQILGIVGSQIETKIFFFSKHTYKSSEMSLTIRKLVKFNFCEQKLAK